MKKIKRSFVSITREFTSHRKLILVHLAIVPEWKVSYEIWDQLEIYFLVIIDRGWVFILKLETQTKILLSQNVRNYEVSSLIKINSEISNCVGTRKICFATIALFLNTAILGYCQQVNRPKLTRLRFGMKGFKRVIMRACYLVVLYGLTVKRRHLH